MTFRIYIAILAGLWVGMLLAGYFIQEITAWL